MIKASLHTEDEMILVSKKEYENYKKLEVTVAELSQQLADLKRMIFGSKSERFIPNQDGQLGLFGQSEEAIEIEKAKTSEITYERTQTKKEKPIRATLPAHLPRVEEIIEPISTGKNAKKIGEEITEILEYNPAKLFVRRIIRPKYKTTNGITIGELPSLPLPKSNAGPSLLAHIMVSKYVDHLPFYRQIQIFKRQKFILSSSTIGGWFNNTAKLLEPLYDVLQQEVLDTDYLQADESPIGVQDSHKPGALHTGYQWVYRNPIKGLVLFKYHHSRERKTAEQVLENFSGHLQTDGYSAYKNLQTKGDISLLGCMAHARRYFEKAKDNDLNRSENALKLIQKLYAIERKCKDRLASSDVRYRYRQIYALPILSEFEIWLNDNHNQVLPKSAIGKAIVYTLKIWENLKRYTIDGRFEIDNNLIENTIRPLALGRKNYLFAGSHKSASNIAMMYSFFTTCKINDIEPLSWLTFVLENILEHKANKLTELLPHNFQK